MEQNVQNTCAQCDWAHSLPYDKSFVKCRIRNCKVYKHSLPCNDFETFIDPF